MRIKLFAFFICFLILVGFSQFNYDSKVNYFSIKNVFVKIPSGNTLKILSFGFENVVSDMLFIWSIQFYSSYTIKNNYDYIEQIFNTITDLTPKYYDPYIVGSWIMALELKDIKMAMRLLEKGSRNIKNEWRFDLELGFYAKRLKDYNLAEKYFKRAKEKPSAPLYLKRFWAHMIYMKDDLTYAYSLWITIFNNATTTIEKDSAFCHLYQIKYEIDKKNLEQKIKQYKKNFGRFPFKLDQLIRASLIAKIPKDFKNKDYIYDSKSGKIKAKRIFKWKKF